MRRLFFFSINFSSSTMITSKRWLYFVVVLLLMGYVAVEEDNHHHYRNLDDVQEKLVDDKLLNQYIRDGFVIVSGLLPDELVDRLSQSGKAVASSSQQFPSFFKVVERGVIFDSGLIEETSQTQAGLDFSPTETFREVALYSKLPQYAAELMQLDPSRQNLRVLRDLFLAKGITVPGCDWHVDDHGFWPESFISSATENSGGKDQDGVNVWIALDDMPDKYKGSMALAAGSHTAPWRDEAYKAIGQNRTKDGGSSKESILQRLDEKRKSGTKESKTLGACTIGLTRPDLKKKMDATAKMFDIKKGDVIFATRRLFHKTIDVNETGLEYYTKHGIQTLNRYSIRYTAGSARLPNGWLAEWSVLSNPNNVGQTLDDIVATDEMWYPKVWPVLEDDIEDQLDYIKSTKLEASKKLLEAEIMEMFGPKPFSASSSDSTDDNIGEQSKEK